MSEIVKTKLRNIGTSFGVILPREVIEEKGLKEGQEIELTILVRKDLKLIEKSFGMARGAKPFVRDRTDRLARLKK
ncbi:hypothetical protein HYZ97_05065 [Candidatus Pacearchaeota archaeon]|nr:hypothetical protein [Candidatus Pacearchaeota archaeon]